MKFSLTADQISAMIADGVKQALASGATTKAASPFLAKGQKADPSDLASKDAAIVARFAKRGFKVTLKDRANPDAPYDVRPFKGWLDQGRIVRKGQKSVLGLFHVTQTDPLPAPDKTAKKAKKTA